MQFCGICYIENSFLSVLGPELAILVLRSYDVDVAFIFTCGWRDSCYFLFIAAFIYNSFTWKPDIPQLCVVDTGHCGFP